MIRAVLLLPFLILVSCFTGRVLCSLMGIIAVKKKDFFTSFVMGTLILLCSSFVSHFLTVLKKTGLSYEKKVSGICLVILMTILYFVFVIITLKNAAHQTSECKADISILSADGAFAPESQMNSEVKGAAGSGKYNAATVITLIIAILLSIICLTLVYSGHFLNTEGDETIETVVSFLDGKEMFSADPLTGVPYREGLPLRHKILCLPGLYAVLSDVFNISSQILVFHIMPAFWFLAGLCSICSLSSAIFEREKDKIFKCGIFLIFALLFVFGSNLSPYAQGFGILSSMWTGYAIRNWVLIPFMLSLLIRKKYTPALLPTVCEAFICRTQYGIGFLAITYALFVLSALILSRICGERRRHA